MLREPQSFGGWGFEVVALAGVFDPRHARDHLVCRFDFRAHLGEAEQYGLVLGDRLAGERLALLCA